MICSLRGLRRATSSKTEDKLLYVRSHERKREHTAGQDKHALIEYSCDNSADWMGGVATMMNESSDGLPEREVSSRAASSGDTIVSDLADDAFTKNFNRVSIVLNSFASILRSAGKS